MKRFTIALFIFASLSSFAQSKGGYFSARGGMSFKDEVKKGVGHISVGVSPNHIFGVGAGIGYIDFEKPYIPLTVDISFFGKPGKISPTVIGSAGYGVYKYNTTAVNIKGGFTGSLNAGVAFPVKNNTKAFITAGYSIYSFSKGNFYLSDNYYKESNIKMVTITAGIKI